MGRHWAGGGLAFALSISLGGGAQAAVEYVRVCDAYGPGYLYAPGTETCVNMNTGETKTAVAPDVDFRGATTLARDAEAVGSAIDWIDSDLDDLREGIAATAALPTPFIQPGDRFAVSGNWGQYEGAHALGLGAAIRIDETLRLSASVGVGLESGVLASGLSLTIGW
jgi:hypothetical protein